MRYYLGPFLKGKPFGWYPPNGVISVVDLASIPQMSQKDGDSRPVGFFGTKEVLKSDWTLLGDGDCREINSDTKMRDAFNTIVGYRPTGNKLVDLVFDVLTNGSDPTGEKGPKPLVPIQGMSLELSLSGHSIVKHEQFNLGHSHWEKVKELLKLDVHSICEDIRSGNLPIAVLRKYVGGLLLKYGINSNQWKILTLNNSDADLIGNPLQPETTLAETFDGDDLDPLGPNYTWTCDATYGFVIYGNRAVKYNGIDTPDQRIGKCNTALSSADHTSDSENCNYGNTIGADAQGGSAARIKSDRTDYYIYFGSYTGAAYFTLLGKIVGGVWTALGDNSADDWRAGTFRTSANGSTIKGILSGTEKFSTTDTSITSNTSVGIYAYRPLGEPWTYISSWSAADLGGAPATSSQTRVGRRTGIGGRR